MRGRDIEARDCRRTSSGSSKRFQRLADVMRPQWPAIARLQQLIERSIMFARGVEEIEQTLTGHWMDQQRRCKMVVHLLDASAQGTLFGCFQKRHLPDLLEVLPNDVSGLGFISSADSARWLRVIRGLPTG